MNYVNKNDVEEINVSNYYGRVQRIKVKLQNPDEVLYVKDMQYLDKFDCGYGYGHFDEDDPKTLETMQQVKAEFGDRCVSVKLEEVYIETVTYDVIETDTLLFID